MGIKAIVVDLYNTILTMNDTAEVMLFREVRDLSPRRITIADVARVWTQKAEEALRNSYGDAFTNRRELEKFCMKETAAAFDVSCSVDRFLDDEEKACLEPVISADVRIFLSTCPLPVCIIANGDRETVEKILHQGLVNAPLIVTSEDVRAYKPRPDIFKKAAELLNVKYEEVLVVSESIFSDLTPAHELGMQTAWINRDFKNVPVHCPADAMFESLDRLSRMMRPKKGGRK